MSTACCLFAVRAEATFAEQLHARVARLAGVYASLGLSGVRVEHVASARAFVGCLAAAPRPGRVLTWGAPLGARTATADELLEAPDAALREMLVGLGCVVALGRDHVRVITSSSGPTPLYTAAGAECEVWATHAVAAALLAHGGVELDPLAVPEYLAYDFVGGGRTLLRDVFAVDLAVRVDLRETGADIDSFWPMEERWAAVGEGGAYEHTERALLASLEQRVPRQARVRLALTGGADSRVLATALSELRCRWEGFTWGEDGWPDVDGARAVGEALGVDTRHVTHWHDDAAILPAFAAEALWADGLASLSLGQRIWPADADVVVGGMAGEVGRAFYYRRAAAAPEPTDTRALVDHLHPEDRLGGAARDSRRMTRDRVEDWIRAAMRTGHRGWRLLDVVYGEQRVARWGRSQIPLLDADFIAGFAHPDVTRGLLSLPLVQRTSDGFHRRFVADRLPELPLAAPAPPPRAARRHRVLAHRARRRLRPPAPTIDRFFLESWQRLPTARDWLVDDVLATPLITSAMGDAWVRAARDGVIRGELRATQQARLAAGPVALANTLERSPVVTRASP